MSASEIIRAYEAGLITRNEAIEQARVETVDALYQQVGDDKPGRGGKASLAERHIGR